MLSNRISIRREFFVMFPFAIASAAVKLKLSFQLPAHQFEIGERVITKRLCNNKFSSNYGGIDLDSGVIFGYCWQYDEWLLNEYRQGWTYFILFDQNNRFGSVAKSYMDFEHESKLAKI